MNYEVITVSKDGAQFSTTVSVHELVEYISTEITFQKHTLVAVVLLP